MKNYISINTKTEDNEEAAISNGFKQLLAKDIKTKIVGKAFLGGYLHGFQFIVSVNTDGSLEGKNNVEHYDLGHWVIDDTNNTLTVNWQNGWDSTTTRIYQLNDKINMYDKESGLWRTSFNQSIEAITNIKNYQFKP